MFINSLYLMFIMVKLKKLITGAILGLTLTASAEAYQMAVIIKKVLYSPLPQPAQVIATEGLNYLGRLYAKKRKVTQERLAEKAQKVVNLMQSDKNSEHSPHWAYDTQSQEIKINDHTYKIEVQSGDSIETLLTIAKEGPGSLTIIEDKKADGIIDESLISTLKKECHYHPEKQQGLEFRQHHEKAYEQILDTIIEDYEPKPESWLGH